MRRPMRRPAAAAAAAIAIVASAALPAAGGARTSAEEVRRQHAVLEQRISSALLELYALETRLASAAAEADAAAGRLAEVEVRQEALERRLALARRSADAAEQGRADRLRALYQAGDVHPLDVLLGAESLDDVLGALQGLRFAAEQDARIVAQARAARRSLQIAARALARQQLEAAAAAAAAADRAEQLDRARAGRAAFVARLRAEEGLKRAEVAALEREAQKAQATAAALSATAAERTEPQRPPPSGTPAAGEEAAPASEPPAAPAPRATSGGRLTVTATAYALPGRTATGIPVAHGVVAVDPSVIPLGTRMTIPGYGEGVAADVGSAVKGAMIDVWFPTVAQARTWGRRTVTITIH